MLPRLKSLELQGYKTFASRTPFEFSNSITAIVGPNGSGKSNIADSIRWVLGEQSYSLLRGKRTEDMIFTGSDLRPRSGMASATITFNNNDGWLPIDYSEVAVTRRAYRDGQNEYLLNGQRVRLRDVSELLASAGLAERTYTIIGQGLVDTALAIKPEERRRLFEEAAGISLHRSRREESLRRLESTRRNLERIRDILSELQPRLRSLERQARRAQEYDQVKSDLQILLREWYGYHWHRAQHEVIEARESVRIQESRLEKSRSEYQQTSDQLSQHRNKLQTLRHNLNEWHRELSSLHNQQEVLNRKLAVADERERSLRLQSENFNHELQRNNEEFLINQDRIRSILEEISKLESEYAETLMLRENAIQVLNEHLAMRQNKEAEIQIVTEKLTGLLNKQVSIRVRLSEIDTQIDKTQTMIHQATQNISKMTGSVELYTADFQRISSQLAQRREIVANLEKELEKTRLFRQETILKKEKAQNDVQEILTEIAREETQYQVLKQAEDALTGYTAGTRLLMDASHQGRIGGVLGTLNQFIQVPKRFERAITAVLGELLDAVIVQTEVDSAMNLLVEKKEKGVLLPLSSIGQPILSEKLEIRGSLGLASDFVNCSEEVRPYVGILLGNVIVVENRSVADHIIGTSSKVMDDKFGGKEWSLVTLAGEVFSSKGPRIIGTKGGEEQSLLSRSRKMVELEDRLEEKNKLSSDLEEKIGYILGNLEKIEQKYKILSDEFRKESTRMDEMTIQINQSSQVMESAKQQLLWHEDQVGTYQTDLETLTRQNNSLLESGKQLEMELQQLQDRLKVKNQELAKIEANNPVETVAQWNTSIAVIENTLKSVKAQLAERNAVKTILETEKAGIISKAAENSRVINELTAEISQWREQERTISGEVQIIQSKVFPAEQEVDILQKEQLRLEKSEQNARHSLNIIDNHTSQTRIGLTRRQDALDSMQRRIEEDFGLVNFEYVDDVSGPTPLPFTGMVEQLPVVTRISEDVEENIRQTKSRLRRIGPVNPEALSEYQEVSKRFTFLNEQVNDLEKAEIDIRKVIQELDLLMQKEFLRTYEAVAAEFRLIFQRLFNGGSARLILSNPDNLTESGIDIEAKLPGRRTQGLSLLSGGERSLTAIALIFSLLKVSPTPFCLLDEVDAMLDEANVNRYCELLLELSRNTQFVVVTHNRYTVQVADYIYGVTLGRDLASQVLSLRVDEINKVIGEE